MNYKNQEFISNSSVETQIFACELAHKLLPGDIIFLSGNLGSGKTTFTQGLAQGLGITKRIISPTFIIVRSYILSFKTFKNLYHIDLYRLESEKDTESVGILEILKEKNSIVVIEWPEKLGKFMPKNRLAINLKVLDDNKRAISIIYE